jgi:protein SCO1/2
MLPKSKPESHLRAHHDATLDVVAASAAARLSGSDGRLLRPTPDWATGCGSLVGTMIERGRAAPSRRQLTAALGVTLCALALVACGSSTASKTSTPTQAKIAGMQRNPAPQVGAFALPDAAQGDAAFPIRAQPGGLLLMYFGYTNCPDICPGTLAGLKLAIHKLDAADAARVQVAMVTVDPNRDTGTVLTSYLANFFSGAHALRTEDLDQLRTLAEAFGVQYDVSKNKQGEEEVGHTALSFAVDDTGRIVDTWPYGFDERSIANDMKILLHRTRSS